MGPEEWLQRYRTLAERAFELRSQRGGGWPTLDELQRWADQQDIEVDLNEAGTSVPALPGVSPLIRPTFLRLPLAVLVYLPEAHKTLQSALEIVQEAVRQYLDAAVAAPSVSSECEALDGLPRRATALAAELLMDELFMPVGGGNTGSDTWQINVDSRWARQYRGVDSISSLLARQHDIAAALHASQAGRVPVVTVALPATEGGRDESGYEFDVALSFAGENREFVSEVSAALKARGIAHFYDEDHEAVLWGENLTEYFDSIYRVKSRFVVLFVSSHYAAKDWTRLERRSALARGMSSATPYVLPIRLDETELLGLLPTVGYLDARRLGVDGIVRAISAKLSHVTDEPTPAALIGVPLTPDDIEVVRRTKPPGWEYLLFAGNLQQHLTRDVDRFRDFQLGYAPPLKDYIPNDAITDFMKQSLSECQALMASLTRLMKPEPQELAFGASGHPGDADLIQHYASRVHDHYRLLLEWTQQVRGVRTEPEAQDLCMALAEFARQPIEEYHRFVEDCVRQIAGIPGLLNEGGDDRRPINITLTFTAKVPDAASRRYQAELERWDAALDG